MATAPATSVKHEGSAAGLRMDAAAFLQLAEDGQNYELIDGVVVMSPGPSPRHQHVTGEIFVQLALFLRQHQVGLAFVETDVHLGAGSQGGDLVYRPEIAFIRSERLAEVADKLVGAPDLVVEVISRGSRRFDRETKKTDYERFGVREYWLIDPARESMAFYRVQNDRFVEIPPDGDRFVSDAVAGFKLDLVQVRKAFHPW